MTPRKKKAPAGLDALGGLTPAEAIEVYRQVFLSRRIDDKQILLKKMGKAHFQINGAGHELVGIVGARHLRRAHDWFILYYRDRGMATGLGFTAEEQLLDAVGAPTDVSSSGRQMPNHWTRAEWNVLTPSSPTGTQYLHAVGAAEAGRLIRELEIDEPAADDEIVYVSSGEGTTSQGEFWEALNSAVLKKAPVLFSVQDNEYAISVPVKDQTAGGSISKAFGAFPGLKVVYADGTDLKETEEAYKDAVAYLRAGKGPVLMHTKVVRPYSHSLSDDHTQYRSSEELEEETKRDPVNTLERLLVTDTGVATAKDLEDIRSAIDEELDEVMRRVLEAPEPNPADWPKHLYSETVDPTDLRWQAPAETDGAPISMGQAINQTLADEMARDPRIIVFGEDVADAETANLDHVKGKGGVFKITHGLQRKFGQTRVFNSPLAEANVIGRAVGMAMRGLRPVVEIQFFDYIWTAMMQLRNELAMIRWRSQGQFSAPVVVRVPNGGFIKGGPYHSQSAEAIFVHTPGMRVAFPGNAADAAGLLRTAIRSEDPVLFLEHKHLYYQGYNRAPYPGKDYTIPIGRARIAQEGTDLTVVTWGAMVKKSLDIAAKMEAEGVSVEVVDVRSFNPIDYETIAASVEKTSKLMVVHEEPYTGGLGGTIASWITEHRFEHLDAPPVVIGSEDSHVPYAPLLEEAVLVNNCKLHDAMRDLAAY